MQCTNRLTQIDYRFDNESVDPGLCQCPDGFEGDACETVTCIDGDGDGVCDDVDQCPGFDDGIDSDGDGIPDGCDNCPADVSKTDPGQCGCGIADTDSDGDETVDCNDICPGEDATGFDSNEDGCIDSLTGLVQMVRTLVEEGVIDSQMENSLVSKVENAEKSTTKDNICAAVDQLEAFKSQVQAQNGKKISVEAAALLLNYTDNIISQLVSQLPEGESC